MQRRIWPVLWACTLLLMTMQAAPAVGATYVVAPFQVNGPDGFQYLEKAVPPMLASRLFWQGKFEPVPTQDAIAQGNAPKGREAVEKLRQNQKADYVIWGSVTILGQDASMDVNVLDAAGKTWQHAGKSPVNNLIGALESVADSINRDVFGRPVAAPQAPAGRAAPALNPEFMVNETQAGTVYLNPQIRYQGATDSERLRSQMLDIHSTGMEVADVDGDGKNEVLLIDARGITAFRWADGRLNELATYTLPTMITPLAVRAYPLGRQNLIVLSCYDTVNKGPNSVILSFEGGVFKVVAQRIQHYLNVVKLPPLNMPTLVGQSGDSSTRVTRGDVFEVMLQGDQVIRGANVQSLPREANVMNFAWVPGSERSGGDYVVVLNDMENLLTFSPKGNRLAKSDDRFSGGSVFIPRDNAMPGMGSSSTSDPGLTQNYYIPMRMVVADADNDGRYEVLVNKPITTAGAIFQNFRTYPQGEIHALQWDGVGLDLLWKTRRIKGTVVDLTLADPNNDGVPDLVVNVNSYPGALGTAKVRTLVILYPLDGARLSSTPNPGDDED